MNKLTSLILFVAGAILIAYGVSASKSLGSDISHFFTGTPTDRSIWLLIGGSLAAVIGLTGLSANSKRL